MIDCLAYLDELCSVTRRELLHPVRYMTWSEKPLIQLKQMLWHLARHRRSPLSHRFSWKTALLALGLAWADRVRDDSADVEALRAFFEQRTAEAGSISRILHRVDEAMHGYSLMYLRQRGKGVYQESIDEIARFLLNEHPHSTNGHLPYLREHPDLLLVDTLGMACPFLAWYGAEFRCELATELATRQLQDFIKNGLDRQTGLPYHAYNDVTKEKMGPCGWGRGAGWLLLGLADSLEWLESRPADFNALAEDFRRLVDTLAQYQSPEGHLRWLVTDPNAHIDTSATALFGYAVARGFSLNLIPENRLQNAIKALEAIRRSTHNGSVGDCSLDAGGIGIYSREFAHHPSAQGSATAFAACMCSLNSGPLKHA